MDSDCNSDLVPNSVDSIEIDSDDDLGFSNESEYESITPDGDIQNLLERVDNLSNNESSASDNDDEPNVPKVSDQADVPELINDVETDDLIIDLDELGPNDQNGDDMFEVLQKDPDWSETFLPIHANQFTQPTGPKLPEQFNMETASALEYFQLFFSNEVIETIVHNTSYNVWYTKSIGEGVCAFTGRCDFLQFNNMKPVQRRIKLYIHACSESGYCQAFNIYLGPGSTQPSRIGATFDVVWNLVEDLHNKYHCIYFDNLYTSIPLLRFLYSKGLYGCGTVKNEEISPSFHKRAWKKLKRGDHKTFQSNKLLNLTCSVWKDTLNVQFASCLSKPNLSSMFIRGPEDIMYKYLFLE